MSSSVLEAKLERFIDISLKSFIVMRERNRKHQNNLKLFETEQWKITVGLQKISGLYCFQRDRINFISWLYTFLFTSSFMTALGIRLVMEIGVNTEIVIENFLAELFMIVIIFKLGISVLQRKSFKSMYTKITDHWRMINNVEELKIMTKNMNNVHVIAKVYALWCFFGMEFFLAMPVGYPLLDYVIPMKNRTRVVAFPCYVEYGLDPEKYYYPLMTQGFFGSLGCVAVFAAFDLSYMMLTSYVIGLFALAKHRISKVNAIMQVMELRNVNALKSNWSIPYIVQAIEAHQLALAYVNDLEDNYNKAWFVSLVINVTTIGGAYVVILVKDTPEEIFRYSAMLIGAFVHFYFIFLPGQKIINASEEVFDACYAVNWYKLSNKSKYLLKVIMTRSLRASYLTGGKMFSLSMDTYCRMLKTSLSCVTLLKRILEF
ncbi:uncharacterized protein LOC106654540 [Trichogramma pretiosum]|uniref:uncharacterized protein LOC106654540 n=1 Tax=Trichogramma pretiosum TaxID=7493 RepID=UPI000C71BF04|nr:uncharacterized protein LOC106654540 [Trichogramma pretiosum]